MRRAADDQDVVVVGQRVPQVASKYVLLLWIDMLESIQAVDAVVGDRQGPAQDIVHGGLQRPFLPVAPSHIFDEDGVGVVHGHLLRRLQDDARAERIRAAELAHILSIDQHLRDEFVAREQHTQLTGIVVPDLVGRQSERLETDLIAQLQRAVVGRHSMGRSHATDFLAGETR